MQRLPVALTIAGSDPSGGAGIQADLKTFHQWGAYGESVITLITVQNSVSVERVEVLPPDLVVEQICAVINDIPPLAAKTGALGSAAVIEAVAVLARDFDFPLVVDPVMVSKHGSCLMQPDAIRVFTEQLLPKVFLLTPNLDEAEALTGRRVDSLERMRDAAKALAGLGAQSVLVKGGHLAGAATDLLYHAGDFYTFACGRVETRNTHGTGCTFSAAITAALARGEDLQSAVRQAKLYTYRAIASNPELGHGNGPLNHHARVPAS